MKKPTAERPAYVDAPYSVQSRHDINQRVEEYIVKAVSQAPDPSVTKIFSPRFCLDDIRMDAHAKAVLEMGYGCSQLVGRTVDCVRWVNILDAETNPCGAIGRFVLSLVPTK